jgi:hypothetical protein
MLNQLRDIASKYVEWLGELWRLWVTLLPIAACFVGFAIQKPPESVYRWLGMFAQVIGIGLAAWGLLKIRTFFELKPYRQVFSEWIARRPRWMMVNLAASPSVGSSFSSSGGVDVLPGFELDSEASVHQRLLALEGIVKGLFASVATLYRRHAKDNEMLKGEIATLQAAISARSEALQAQLKRAQTDGVAASLAGAALLFVGVVLTSVPVELSHLFGNHDDVHACEQSTASLNGVLQLLKP